MEFEHLIQQEEYKFLWENGQLGKNIILLGLAGSYAYGTNVEHSDIDIRGITMNSKSDLIGLTSFEQYTDNATDTVIFSFNKIVGLLLSCNPNVIEILGLKPEHYLYMTELGKTLLDNRKLFLSRRAIQSFGGYAEAQLRRLENALARDTMAQSAREQHIFHSVQNALMAFNNKFDRFDNSHLEIFVDKAVHPEWETEIFVNAQLNHYPLRDYLGIWDTMTNVIRDYDRLGKRNKKKDDLHLNKHAMHLLRLFMMAIDILEKEEIITYRTEEHDLLMQIRSGAFQNADGNFSSAFYDLLSEYEAKLRYASENTALPEEPDMEAVQALVMDANEKVIRGEV